jgi:hypothetical protein
MNSRKIEMRNEKIEGTVKKLCLSSSSTSSPLSLSLSLSPPRVLKKLYILQTLSLGLKQTRKESFVSL